MALHPSSLARTLALAASALALSACAVWSGGDAPMRTSVSLSAPSTVERPEWLHKLVVRMDEQAFPNGGALSLKLSYELSPEIAQRPVAALTGAT